LFGAVQVMYNMMGMASNVIDCVYWGMFSVVRQRIVGFVSYEFVL
jgi:uncharacterized protein (DUF849 family)